MNKRPFEKEVFFNFNRLYSKIVYQISDTLDTYGITIYQFDILDAIYDTGYFKLKLSKIRENVHSRNPDITRTINRMEVLGLVKRVKSPEDRRIYYIEITEKAVQLLNDLKPRLNEILVERLQNLSGEDLSQLNNLLIKTQEDDIAK